MKSLKAIAHDLRVDAHALWLCARDPEVPVVARLFGLFVAAYAVSPIDLVPDFIPVLGLLDDAILIPAGLWLFARMVPPTVLARHRAAAEAASQRPVSKAAAAMIAAIWVMLALWLGTLLWSARFY